VAFKEAEAASTRWAPPRFEQLFSYGSYAALAACLFGFAWAAGSYFSGGQSPFYAAGPSPTWAVAAQESVAPEMLRTAQKMAEDIRALKASVEALRAAQSQAAKDATALEGQKSRLVGVNTETGASIAELAGKVEHMQREPAAKLSQILERLDRIERQIAPLATASLGAASPSGAAAEGTPAIDHELGCPRCLRRDRARRKSAGLDRGRAGRDHTRRWHGEIDRKARRRLDRDHEPWSCRFRPRSLPTLTQAGGQRGLGKPVGCYEFLQLGTATPARTGDL
jgi:hypothetical protein